MEQITKEELLDVIGKFELGDNTEVVSVEPYGSGHINDTFRLEVKEDGQEAGKKADQLRAVIKGQRAATIPFDLSDENITRSFVEQVEKELTLGGRHTYLYAPKDDEPVGLVVRHLNRAGIIVLLVLNKDLKNKEEIKGSLAKYSKYIKHWEEGEKGDVDSTVQTIRKLTEYAEDVYGVASHI